MSRFNRPRRRLVRAMGGAQLARMWARTSRFAGVLRRQKVMVIGGLLLAGLAVPLVGGIASSATYGHATLTCPRVVAPGTTFNVEGSRFPADTTVTLSDGADIGPGGAKTNAGGAFTTELTISPTATMGSDTITATAANGTASACTVEVAPRGLGSQRS